MICGKHAEQGSKPHQANPNQQGFALWSCRQTAVSSLISSSSTAFKNGTLKVLIILNDVRTAGEYAYQSGRTQQCATPAKRGGAQCNKQRRRWPLRHSKCDAPLEAITEPTGKSEWDLCVGMLSIILRIVDVISPSIESERSLLTDRLVVPDPVGIRSGTQLQLDRSDFAFGAHEGK